MKNHQGKIAADIIAETNSSLLHLFKPRPTQIEEKKVVNTNKASIDKNPFDKISDELHQVKNERDILLQELQFVKKRNK